MAGEIIMPIPHIEPTNITGLLGIVQYANTVTNNYAGLLLTILIISVMFAITLTKGYSTSQSSLLSFGLGFVLAALLWALGLILPPVLIIILVLAMASLIWNLLEN